MKKLYVFLLFFLLFMGCKEDSTMMPDELGQKLFNVFQSDDIERLRPLILSANDETMFYDRMKDNTEFINRIDSIKNHEKFRNKLDKENFTTVLEYYIRSRDELLKKESVNIKDLEINEIFGNIYWRENHRTGHIALEIRSKAKDDIYLGFRLIEVVKGHWKISGPIWIEESLGEDFIKYKYLKTLEELD